MKQSYIDYFNELTGNRMDVLEKLITTKYKKFKKFYKIVSKHSDDIAHISYRFSEDNSLDVDITVNPNCDINRFADSIQFDAETKYNIETYIDTRVVYVSLSTD